MRPSWVAVAFPQQVRDVWRSLCEVSSCLFSWYFESPVCKLSGFRSLLRLFGDSQEFKG